MRIDCFADYLSDCESCQGQKCQSMESSSSGEDDIQERSEVELRRNSVSSVTSSRASLRAFSDAGDEQLTTERQADFQNELAKLRKLHSSDNLLLEQTAGSTEYPHTAMQSAGTSEDPTPMSPSNSGLHCRAEFDLSSEEMLKLCSQPSAQAKESLGPRGAGNDFDCTEVRPIFERELRAHFNGSSVNHRKKAGVQHEKATRRAEQDKLAVFFTKDAHAFIVSVFLEFARSAAENAQRSLLLMVPVGSGVPAMNTYYKVRDMFAEDEQRHRSLTNVTIAEVQRIGKSPADWMNISLDECTDVVVCLQKMDQIHEIVSERALYRNVIVLQPLDVPEYFVGKSGFETARLMTVYTVKTPCVSLSALVFRLDSSFASELDDAAVQHLYRWGVYPSSIQEANVASLTIRVLADDHLHAEARGASLLFAVRQFLKKYHIARPEFTLRSYGYLRGCAERQLDSGVYETLLRKYKRAQKSRRNK